MLTYDGLSSFERKAVDEMYERLKNEIPRSKHAGDDPKLTMWRFLKARNFDLDKADNMYRKAYIWRKSFQIDTILEDFQPKEYFRKYVWPTELGFDKNGYIVVYFPMARIDGRDVLKCDSMNGYIRNYMWFAEWTADRCRQFKEKTGKEPYLFRAVFIVDLDKLTFSNATYKYSINILLRLVRFLSDNYPEFLSTMYVINAPAFIAPCFNILKAVMSQELLQKIQIFGHEGWKTKILKDIDPDIIPAFLGGNRTDPDGDPMCKSVMRGVGGKFPEKYYMSDKDKWFKDETRVTKVTISRREKEEICIYVTENESKIHWEFYVNSDIEFGLFLKVPEEQTLTEILPFQKYDTLFGIEIGWYKARCAGTYVITFDNSYSRMTSKQVQYCITVTKPSS